MTHENAHVSTAFIHYKNRTQSTTIKYDSSICHFKFPKVLLAHILGKAGTICIVFVKCLFKNMGNKQFLLKSVYI